MDGLVGARYGQRGRLKDLTTTIPSHTLQLGRVDPALLRSPPRFPVSRDLLRHERMVLHGEHARGLACRACPANVPVSALLVVPDHFRFVILLRVDYAPIAKAAAPPFGLAELVVRAEPVGAQALRHVPHKVDGTRRGFQLVRQSGSDRDRERKARAASARHAYLEEGLASLGGGMSDPA